MANHERLGKYGGRIVSLTDGCVDDRQPCRWSKCRREGSQRHQADTKSRKCRRRPSQERACTASSASIISHVMERGLVGVWKVVPNVVDQGRRVRIWRRARMVLISNSVESVERARSSPTSLISSLEFVSRGGTSAKAPTCCSPVLPRASKRSSVAHPAVPEPRQRLVER
jgi:hypothetical protein